MKGTPYCMCTIRVSNTTESKSLSGNSIFAIMYHKKYLYKMRRIFSLHDRC